MAALAALIACGSDTATTASVTTNTASSGGAGGGDGGCPSGLSQCGDDCVQTELDPAHCGGCDQSCDAGEVCSDGQCKLQCAGGTTKCSDACVDTTTDPAHCGGCDMACAAEQICHQGSCSLVCVGGSTKCGEACVDTNHHPAHCGGCDQACPNKQVCAGGGCCPQSQLYCDNGCIDPLSDASHCGGCGKPCGGMTPYCIGGSCVDVALSCADALASDANAKDGVYSIDPDGAGPEPPFDTYCDMSGDMGGWTLLMKIDGSLTTFSYAAALWTDSSVLNPDKPDLDLNEAKLAGFSTMAVSEVRLGMIDAQVTRWITTPVIATSLLSLFQGGYTATTLGRGTWKSLLAAGSLQSNCNKEGFNLDVSLGLRIGIVGNQENNCSSCDSWLGFGAAPWGGCELGSTNNSCGNRAACSPDNGVKNTAAFGYVMIR